ncbi:hypothetical protein HMPREF3120_06610 [Corynebacterium sp. HMSC11D10]|uniref:hypothetical protein n=1 Tax=Corynebacterium sp. HMSC11D10 TaxID=1581088 RepID=UPI0008A38DF1|nr:hypothetical protein [Corynebacterium sp. HMSC11D10]OFU54665.1 hypothetical protein HMPREF3120_06610 [Corynebacterium sp. HMSC11D10]
MFDSTVLSIVLASLGLLIPLFLAWAGDISVKRSTNQISEEIDILERLAPDSEVRRELSEGIEFSIRNHLSQVARKSAGRTVVSFYAPIAVLVIINTSVFMLTGAKMSWINWAIFAVSSAVSLFYAIQLFSSLRGLVSAEVMAARLNWRLRRNEQRISKLEDRIQTSKSLVVQHSDFFHQYDAADAEGKKLLLHQHAISLLIHGVRPSDVRKFAKQFADAEAPSVVNNAISNFKSWQARNEPPPWNPQSE